MFTVTSTSTLGLIAMLALTTQALNTFRNFINRLFFIEPILNSFGAPYPKNRHITLDSDNLKARLIIIGDIHGCLEEMKDLLKKCEYDETTTSVVLVGDLVNKGPKSAEVVRYARQINAFCVRGNHDEFVLGKICAKKKVQAGEQKKKSKDKEKKLEYIKSFDNEDISWLNELPYTISLPTFNSIVVHAGLLPDLPLNQQREIDMCTMRNLVLEENYRGGSFVSKFTALPRPSRGEAWAEVWTNYQKSVESPQHVYFGHDAKRGLQLLEHATGLDSGACYGKQLSAMILPERRLVQVAVKCVYEKPGGGD